MKLVKLPRRPSMYRTFCLLYADKSGSPVLKEKCRWHMVNGALWRLRGYTYVFTFRRNF